MQVARLDLADLGRKVCRPWAAPPDQLEKQDMINMFICCFFWLNWFSLAALLQSSSLAFRMAA